MAPHLSVIIPVYNERRFIADVLARVRTDPTDKEIIIVDDGSTDGTREYLAGLHGDDVRVLLIDGNRGKGTAIRTGFEEARGEVVIVQDADLEYDPRDFPKLLRPIDDGRADAVFGTRFAAGRPAGWLHFAGNRLTTLFVNALTGSSLGDAWVCYKAVRRDVLRTIDLRESGFAVELELAVKLADAGWRLAEIPISYRPRSYDEGKKIGWRDALTGFWVAAKYADGRRASGLRTAVAVAWLLVVNLYYFAHLLAVAKTSGDLGGF